MTTSANSEILLSELKVVLGDLYDQNDNKNKELVGLIKSLVKRIESAEHELFNTEGSINELRDRIRSLEYHAKHVDNKHEAIDSNKENRAAFWRGVLSKFGGGLLIMIATYVSTKLGWLNGGL